MRINVSSAITNSCAGWILFEEWQMSGYKIITFKIQLAGTDIWREFEIEAYSTLEKIHEVIQIIMGWQNCHLYQFNIGDEQVLPEDPDFENPLSKYSTETKNLSDK